VPIALIAMYCQPLQSWPICARLFGAGQSGDPTRGRSDTAM
jgi:hypothetical protein